jgi:ribosome-associated protein
VTSRTPTVWRQLRDRRSQGTTLADIDRSESTRWAVEAARAADEKKGVETLVLAVGDILAVTEYFVITHGTNRRQVRTLTEEVEQRITEAGGPKPLRIEGLADLTWVLLDYGDFVVHVFSEEARRFYELERLWADVPRVDWHDAAQLGAADAR